VCFFLGVDVSAGKLPGPMQLMKLAGNSKFREAYAEVESELQKSGVDMRSKVRFCLFVCYDICGWNFFSQLGIYRRDDETG